MTGGEMEWPGFCRTFAADADGKTVADARDALAVRQLVLDDVTTVDDALGNAKAVETRLDRLGDRRVGRKEEQPPALRLA
jgi:hypothetical protein